jgi:quercetin dioxygenase-like cupin family protein
MNPKLRRFVQAADFKPEPNAWTVVEWLSRPDMVAAEHLLLVRAFMDPFRSHPFHRHPTREEIIYVIEGTAEQWVGQEHRILKPGEMAHIPVDTVHGTYNPFPERLVFLAILAPAGAPGPDVVDVSTEEPWKSLRRGFPPVT